MRTFDALLGCLLLMLLTQRQWAVGQQAMFNMCGAAEVCVSEQHCNETDDSGLGAIGPRLGQACGNGLVCCDREQLESWNASVDSRVSRQSKKANKPTPVSINTMSNKLEPSGYDSCGVNMECVPRKLCKDDVIIDDGRFILNPRIGAPCERVLFRCCAVDQQVDHSDSPYVQKLKDFKYQGCGYSNAKGLIPDQDNYEYPKDVALFAEFPWMMVLMTGRNRYLCGGTLIHPQLVLTSAHNIANQTVDTLLARAGEWDLNSIDEPHEHQTRRIKQIIRHAEFEPERYYNDIALLVLDEPLTMQPHIQPLCLPPTESPEVQAQLRDGQCFATGWGGKLPDSDKHEHLLKRIELPVVSKQECQAQLRVTRLGKRFRLRPSFICAGGIEGKDTCKGDGGSPLFCTLPGQSKRFQLAGIVSWGIECAEEDVPAVYANVPYLRSWIDEQIKPLKLTLDTP
ncbi:phenoloxidase-activating factor 2 isoform X2 [Drosophila busckii]|nr:phenoloxidase-activating factor 2 isoform X2 [Drosophila busckii]XP_017835949.1 phenoloxidase-activating factor 2 isoform X2 [Drosophila busckii]XP_017835950.1 phenoloxidase-activating factor 2 isoform X2 [Drosophila busckii]